jgi:hypothetical protein
MKDHVTLIDELRGHRVVVNGVDRVVKTRLAFEVLDVFDRSGGKIVDDVDFVAALNVSVSQMRSDETGAACDEYSQPLCSL